MKGIIKAFNQQKGYGFVSCHGEDYFFHISDWISAHTIPEIGMDVEFDTIQNEKGLKAVKVSYINNIPRFIAFQNDRIKISNIMHYGIKNIDIQFNCNQTILEKADKLSLLIKELLTQNDISAQISALTQDIKIHIRFYQDFFELTNDRRINLIVTSIDRIHKHFFSISNPYYSPEEIESLINSIKAYGFALDDVDKYKNNRYLYVHTYQKNTYIYYESESFSVDEKVNELDSYFIGTGK